MNKQELVAICDLKELKLYEASAEYKKIVKDCEAKSNIIRDEILASYRCESTMNRDEEYDFHDKQFAYVEFLKVMLPKIKSTSKWAQALKAEIKNDIKYAEIGIGTRALNEFGIPYSWNKLTAMDMKRVAAGNYRQFYTILNGLIFTLDTEMQKTAAEEAVY